MKKLCLFLEILDIVLLTNVYSIYTFFNVPLILMIPAGIVLSICFLIINIKPANAGSENTRLNIMYDGMVLMRAFLYSFLINITALVLWIRLTDITVGGIVTFSVLLLVLGGITAFGGMLRIFFTCQQLRISGRVMIILFWWVPLINIYIILKVCKKCYNEFMLESDRLELNNVRKENEICRTKYPILLVHGVFFRDLKYFNYWGRVPKELIKNGAEIYYGNQRSADSVERCAYQLKDRIEEIIKTTGAEKVNIIAHSKGGLDSRYAISCLGMDKYVASLTTVNTPHKGCLYADFILNKSSDGFKNFLANRYNSALKKFGETDADFIAAISDLTAERCSHLNNIAPNMNGVYYRSVGSKMKKGLSAGFPLCLSYYVVKMFYKGGNDGLVDVESMKWGSEFVFYEPKTRRGLSHGDMIDLMREDIKDFDVREEYVRLTAQLKAKGF